MTPGATGSADPPTASRRPQARKGEGWQLRDQILDATERLLLATGSSDSVSIRAVADAVGVTPPAIYRHFPDKASLIFEVCDRHFVELDDRFKQAIAGLGDPVEALDAIGRAYIDFGTENPEPYRILFTTGAADTPEEYQDGRLTDLIAFGTAMRIVQAAIDAGRFRPGYDDAATVAMFFWARVHGLTSLLITKPNFPWPEDREAFVAEYIDSCLRGLLAEGDPAAS